MSTTVRCQRCRTNLSVSAKAQAVRCPMCSTVIPLRSAPVRYGPPPAAANPHYGPQLQHMPPSSRPQPRPRPRPFVENMQYGPQFQHMSPSPRPCPPPPPAENVQYVPQLHHLSPSPQPVLNMQYEPPLQMPPSPPLPPPRANMQYGPQLQQQQSPRPRPRPLPQSGSTHYGPPPQEGNMHYGPPPQEENMPYGQQLQHVSPRPRPRPQPVQYYPKRALLCGVSYRGQDKFLKGSINDVNSMKYFLTQSMGFPHEAICVLTEDEKDPSRIPTMDNIRRAMQWLVQGCRSGDSLVFHYSGHGTRTNDLDGDEVDGKDECLCPLDYKSRGYIVDDEINEILVRPLPHGAKLHAIIDTCFSGTLLDLPFLCITDWQGHYWDDHRTSYHNKGTSGGMAFCFSACEDHQNSGDTTVFTGGVSTGAMTYSFIKAVESQTAPTYGGLLTAIHNKIHEAQKIIGAPNVQDAQLSSSDKFDINSMKFVL